LQGINATKVNLLESSSYRQLQTIHNLERRTAKP
jgi:hypothetical protein